MVFRPQTLLRFALAAVVVAAIGFTAVRLTLPVFWYLGFSEGTYHGPNTNRLKPDEAVALTESFRAAPASTVLRPASQAPARGEEPEYEWSPTTPEGDLAVASGTRGVVKLDPAGDKDDCFPDRSIAVELAGGPHKGTVVALPRQLLRRVSQK
jgi:hypothetical protein